MLLRLVRFLPLLMVVMFAAWCTQSRVRPTDSVPLRLELTELFTQQGLVDGMRRERMDDVAKRAGRSGLNDIFYNASASASVDALRWLVDHGAAPASIGAPGGVPLLHKAAMTPTRVRLEYLLSLGLDVNQRGPGGDTLVHTAARAGLDDGVLQLLRGKGLKVNDTNAAGQQPLHVAALKSLDPLVRSGADVDAVDGQGRTALHQAAADRRAEVAAELVRLGASVFKTDAKGRTPLHLAVQSGATSTVDMLVAAGAPRTARDADGLMPDELNRNRSYAGSTGSSYGPAYSSGSDYASPSRRYDKRR